MSDGMRVAMLISGGGTTMREIILASKDGRLRGVKPALVISSDPDAGGLTKAKRNGMKRGELRVVARRDFATPEAFGEVLLSLCRKFRIDFIGQYGWMPKTPTNLIQEFRGMMTNQHPGPLDPGYPDFGGKGMFGRRVHCARLNFVKSTNMHHPWTEVVAQRVNEEFDRGAVVCRRRVPILDSDDVATLQARALIVEHAVQIEALQMFANGRVRESALAKRLIARGEEHFLANAKIIAKQLYPDG